MRENLGLQVAVIIFASLTVILAVSTYVYYSGYLDQRGQAQRRAEELRAMNEQQETLVTELQAVKFVVTDEESDTARQIQEVHSADVQRVQPSETSLHRPTYPRLVGYMEGTAKAAADREARVRSELLAVREDLAEQTDLHQSEVAGYLTAAEEREAEIASQRREDAAQRERMSAQIDRMGDHSMRQSDELAATRLRLDNVQSDLTGELEKLGRQYDVVRDRWEATQVDTFDQPDGKITVADARYRTAQIDLGRASGLSRGTVFQVYDPDAMGIVNAKAKGVVEVTLVEERTAQARIVSDSLRNPILSGDLIFTPLWQAGVQRQFCLLGILDIDGDGQDDGETIRNLIERQHAEIEAEVDAAGRPRGELTAATRYVVVGERPWKTAEDAPAGAYDQMLAKSKELGIDQISLDKLLDYLNYRPATVANLSNPNRGGPMFRPRYRTQSADE